MASAAPEAHIDEGSSVFVPLQIAFQPNTSTVRHVYIRPHTGHDSLPKDRTLFVAGLPANLTHQLLGQLFSKFGDLERAAIHSSGLSAVILYSSSKGLQKALRAANKDKLTILDEPERPEGPYGLKSWVEAHKALKPGNIELQQQLDDWTKAYEEEEERKKQEALKAMEDDGWTVVQRHKGRKKNVSGTGVTVGAVSAGAAATAKEKKSDSVPTNFYRFQQRDRRRTELLDLREKFEQDKQRLAELKQARRFKPY